MVTRSFTREIHKTGLLVLVSQSRGMGTPHHVRVFRLVNNFDVIELNIQELVDRYQNSSDSEIVLELDGHLLVNEGLEEGIEKLW